MSKKKLFILAVFLGISLIGLIFLFFTWQKEKEDTFPVQSLAELPLLEARGVRFTGWDEWGRKSWILKAEEAVQFSQRIILKKVKVNLFEEGEPASEGVADEVIVESPTSDLYLRGNVHIISYRDGAELKTHELKWDGSQKRLYTEGEITIKKAGLVIQGKGLIGNPDLSLIIIKNQVTTYFEEGGF